MKRGWDRKALSVTWAAIACVSATPSLAAHVEVSADEVLVKLRAADGVNSSAERVAADVRGVQIQRLHQPRKDGRSPPSGGRGSGPLTGFEQRERSAWHRVKLQPSESVPAAISRLQADPDVDEAEPNYLWPLSFSPNDADFEKQWGMENAGQTGGRSDADIDAAAAWDATTGSTRVVVAVLDSGADLGHPDLANNVWRNIRENSSNRKDDDKNGYIDDVNGYDFYNDDNNPADDIGHGTHVAGIIGAIGHNGQGVAGVSWVPQLMVLKVCRSSCSTSAIAAGIYYAVDNGASIINMSFGGPDYSSAILDALDYANKHGVVVVAAAGNEGLDISVYEQYPANYEVPNVLAVAATDHTDALAVFSNYGDADIAAPGEEIFSTLPRKSLYGYMSGTSMAAPHVSGALALLLGKYPNLIGEAGAATSALFKAADRLTSLKPYVKGARRLNVRKLVPYHYLPLGADVDGDQRDDVVAIDAKYGKAYVALSNGSRFGASKRWTSSLRRYPAAVLAADFDGDKKADIATVDRSNGAVYVSRSTGGTFEAPRKWLASLSKDTPWSSFAAGDVDGDGRADLIFFAQRSGKVYVALSNQTTFASPTQWHANFAFRGASVASGDFNGDGKADIVNFSVDARADTWVALSDGSSFGARKLWNDKMAQPNTTPLVADVNGDKRDDVVFLYQGVDGRVRVALSNGSSAFVEQAGVWRDKFAYTPQVAFAGRFNGDSRTDLAVATQDATADVFVAVSSGNRFSAPQRWHDSFAP